MTFEMSLRGSLEVHERGRQKYYSSRNALKTSSDREKSKNITYFNSCPCHYLSDRRKFRFIHDIENVLAFWSYVRH